MVKGSKGIRGSENDGLGTREAHRVSVSAERIASARQRWAKFRAAKKKAA
jgi:hypothetical protein